MNIKSIIIEVTHETSPTQRLRIADQFAAVINYKHPVSVSTHSEQSARIESKLDTLQDTINTLLSALAEDADDPIPKDFDGNDCYPDRDEHDVL